MGYQTLNSEVSGDQQISLLLGKEVSGQTDQEIENDRIGLVAVLLPQRWKLINWDSSDDNRALVRIRFTVDTETQR